MQDASELRRALAAHLDYYRELGIAGISRDPAWSTRTTQAPPIEAVPIEAAPIQAAPIQATSAIHVPDVEVAESPIAETAIPPSVIAPDAIPPSVIAASAPVAPSAEPIADVPDDMAKARAPHLVLKDIRADIGDACTRCKLHKLGRKQIVFGVGSPTADLMFVGEAPGRDEDEQGEPFVGRAGQLLTKIIEAINLTRDDVYIANVIKCRPPENRNPEPDEVATCEPFLFRQVDAIKPKVIVALGTFAAHALLKTDMPISRLRGRTYTYRGAQLICTFHPAYLLRSPERKRDTWEDMKKVRALLQGEDA